MIEDWGDDEESQEARELANERSNDHIETYLADYLKDPSPPGHALMIAGEWGIGKSYFVRQLVKKYADGDTNHHYVHVSLAGLQTIREMDVALSVALHPVLDNGFFKVASTGVTLLTKYFRVDPEIRMHVFVNKFKAALYVFDDLERCEAPIQTTMGYINQFVEREGVEGRKVVVVAHEEPLSRRWPEYGKFKEKLIGQTFKFQPVIRRPLEQFIGVVPSASAKPVLAEQFDLILKRYTQSSLNNLRVLKQAVWDFARLVDLLTDEHRSNKELMTSLIDTFLPLWFEYKADRLKSEEIAQAGGYNSFAMFERDAEKESNWKKFRRRYPDTSIEDRVFNGDTLADIVVQGFMDKDLLQSACNEHHFVAGRKKLDSWRRLWDVWNESDEDAAAIIEDVEKRFQERQYVIPGELLHVTGLRLWLAFSNLISSSPSDVVVEFKQYTDELYRSGRIGFEQEPHEELRLSGYGGMGIKESDKPEYRECFDYYKMLRARFLSDNLPKAAADLIEIVRTQPRAFIEKICFTNGGSYEYRDIPVLAHLNIDQFINALRGLAPYDMQAVFSAIRERYERNKLRETLSDELDWLIQLKAKLEETALSLSGFARFRIERMIEYSIVHSIKSVLVEDVDPDEED